MTRNRWGTMVVVAATLVAPLARAQDPGPAAQNDAPIESSLGRMPGAPHVLGEGSSDGLLIGRGSRRVPSSISRPHNATAAPLPRLEALPGPRRVKPRHAEALAIPVDALLDTTPQQGMTLDQAIDLLRRENLGLRAKALEIPQADADILTAGLRANPFVYMDGQLLPYKQYNTVTNPGGPAQYDLNVTLPFDWNLKRRARMAVADRARTVVAAMYQNAVRVEIGNLYSAYVDVLAARETARLTRAAVEGLDRVLATVRTQKSASQVEIDQVEVQRDAADLGRIDAETSLRAAKRRLAAMLSLPPDRAPQIELAGTIYDRSPPPPPVEELMRLAVSGRPDLSAFRMGVTRAQADVLLARASRFSDVYVLYQPFTLQNNHPFNAPSSTSWTLGATVAVPLWDRNQGGIRRSQVNMQQTRIETEALERIVQTEVQDAYDEYVSTRQAVDEMQSRLVPAARRVLDENLRLYRAGQVALLSFLVAQDDYGAIVRQFRDTLVRHRRSMLDLNTAVGQRILP